MHSRAAQQTTPKNKPRKRQLAKNATDRQQTNRQRDRQRNRKRDRRTDSRGGQRVIRIRGGHWQHAGHVRNNHPVQMPMWPQGGKGRETERVNEWEWQGGSAVVKGNMWLILRLPHPPQTSEKLQVAREVRHTLYTNLC